MKLTSILLLSPPFRLGVGEDVAPTDVFGGTVFLCAQFSGVAGVCAQHGGTVFLRPSMGGICK